MNKRNKDLLKLTKLFKKLTAAVFTMGVKFINKPYEKIFLKDMRRIEQSLYLLHSSRSKNTSIGYRTFYCGVNTYVPPELKNYWISDHHFLSVYYRIGGQSFNMIPYNNELYTVNFRRISISSSYDENTIKEYFRNFSLIDEIFPWIQLFYSNQDERVLYDQGLVYPEIILFNRDKMTHFIKMHQILCGIRHIAEAREKISKGLEHALASII